MHVFYTASILVFITRHLYERRTDGLCALAGVSAWPKPAGTGVIASHVHFHIPAKVAFFMRCRVKVYNVPVLSV